MPRIKKPLIPVEIMEKARMLKSYGVYSAYPLGTKVIDKVADGIGIVIGKWSTDCLLVYHPDDSSFYGAAGIPGVVSTSTVERI